MQLVSKPGKRHNPPVVNNRLFTLNDLNVFGAIRTISATLYMGRISTRPDTFTSSPLMMASVSGRRIMNTVPWPGTVSISMMPLSRPIWLRTISIPTPGPTPHLLQLTVEEAGLKDQVDGFLSR